MLLPRRMHFYGLLAAVGLSLITNGDALRSSHLKFGNCLAPRQRHQKSLSSQRSAKKYDDAEADGGFKRMSPDSDKEVSLLETSGSTAELDNSDVKEGMRVKLKDEISSPFRKVRQFIYTGMGLAGSLGTITAVPQLLFAVQDAGDGVVAAVTNVAVDVGAVVLAIVLWDRDAKAEKVKLERYTKKEKLLSYQMTANDKEDREKELSMLPIQIQISEKDENATRIVALGELQSKGKQNIIIVAGKRDFVRDAVISAKIEGADLFNSKEIYVVPVVLEDDQLEAALAKGFGAAKESLMSAPYIGKPMQVSTEYPASISVSTI